MTDRNHPAAPKPPIEPTETGSREYNRREANEKAQKNAEQIMEPGPPPPPGVEEDYGKRAGEVPSEEPGNKEKSKSVKPT